VQDLVEDTRPVTARAVLAAALLGAEHPQLPVAHLVGVASLFGIRSGAARTSLWRMVSDGELTTDNATYALTGRLLERRQSIDTASRAQHTPTPGWDGTWELAVVALDRRAAMDRLGLRKAATILHLAEIREGIWTRPDNLDPARHPAARELVSEQCVQYRSASSDISEDAVSELFGIAQWTETAHRLLQAMQDETEAAPYENENITATLSHQFTLSIAVVRHLETDPLLPASLLPADWPAEALRLAYRSFDLSFLRTMNGALGHPAPA
jgi:phenylacetic acid degradation operon negative regulatory protein